MKSSQMDKARAAGVTFARELAQKVHILYPASLVHVASCRYIHGMPCTLEEKLAQQRQFKHAAGEEFERMTGVKIF